MITSLICLLIFDKGHIAINMLFYYIRLNNIIYVLLTDFTNLIQFLLFKNLSNPLMCVIVL